VLALLGIGLALGVAVPGHSKYALALAGAVLLAVVSISRIEIAYVVLLAVAVLGRARLGTSIWTPAEILVIVVVLVRGLSLGRRPTVPLFLAIYCGWFLVAAAQTHISGSELRSLGRYLLPPLLAVATAAVARDPAVRRRIVVVLLAGALLAAVAIYVQVFVQGYSGDQVTGTFGTGQANVLALVMMVPATVFFALAVERVRWPLVMLAAALVLASCGVLSSGRAVFAFVPAAFGAVVISYGFSARRSRGARRAMAMLLPVIALAPILVVVYQGLFPGRLAPISSVSNIQQYLNQSNPGGALPGRGIQLNTALDQAAAGGVETALIGRGIGVTRADIPVAANTNLPGSAVSLSITATNPTNERGLLTPVQQTSGLWVGVILTETGWVGVALFIALLVYLIVLGRRTRDLLPSGSLDRGLMIALPGLAWLTLLGGFYISVFWDSSYDAFFWPLVGVCIGIAIDARSRLRAAKQPAADLASAVTSPTT
jgi:hypothetical protein